MGRYLFIAFLFCTTLFGCQKESTLDPSPIKNWFTISKPLNPAAVDAKIYDIWQKHEIAIFYNDTIGYEDRGRRDANGDPIFYYEILDLSYDISTSTYDSSVEWEGVDVDDPAKKMRMLPLLDLIEDQMLGFVKEVGINLPAIFIVESLSKGGDTPMVYREFNFIALSLEQFEDTPEVRKQYVAQFVAQTCSKKIAPNAEEFYRIASAAMTELTASDFWDMQWSELFRNYSYERDFIDALDYDIDALEQELRTLDPSNEDEEDRYYEVDDMIFNYYVAYDDEEYYRAMDCRSYGILSLIRSDYAFIDRIPTKSIDLDQYMSAVLSYTLDEFSELNSQYPLVIKRFEIIEKLLIEAGFDLDKIRKG